MLAEHISSNLSPMGTLAKYLKKMEPGCKVVFIGPCTAKKAEQKLPEVEPYVDAVLTFEELQALIDSRDIDLASLEEDVLDNASYFGRIFARGGGLTDAVAEGLKERGLDADFTLKPMSCSGLEECRTALLRKKSGKADFNFIEGMKSLKLETFELSENFVYFYDKLEKANYFLENILETLDEPGDSRLIAWLLESPVADGGQWDMIVSLIEKYGIVPKYAMPETTPSSESAEMNAALTEKLRGYACVLRREYKNGESIEELRGRKDDMCLLTKKPSGGVKMEIDLRPMAIN